MVSSGITVPKKLVGTAMEYIEFISLKTVSPRRKYLRRIRMDRRRKGGKSKEVVIKETLTNLQSDEDDDESDTDASTSSSGEENE